MKRNGLIVLGAAMAGAAIVAGCGGGGDDTPPPQAVAPAAACAALVGKVFDGGEVVSTDLVAADAATQSPEHCALQGRIQGTEINFAAKLPTAWNGKARMGASGGWQGTLVNASVPSGNASPIAKGYVDFVTDGGHVGNHPAGAAFDVSWIDRPEALANFSGIAYQRVTEAMKELSRQHYGKVVERTYFEGCSGGGHLALVMAQRYPKLFDGIIAAAPAPNFVGTFLGWQRPAKALDVPGALPSPAKLQTLSRAVLAQCDRQDGLEDGIVSNPTACNFDPEPLRCQGTDSDSCLTDPQMNYVKELSTDTRYSDSSLLVKGLRLVGNEDDPNNLLRWSTPLPGLSGNPSLFKVATGSVIQVLTRNPNIDPSAYVIANDEPNIRNLSGLLDAWPGDLSAFGASGGKLIIWNGTADTPVPFDNQVAYHAQAVASLGGAARAQSTIRSYFLPGVGHCGGGAGADSFDYLEAMDRWVGGNESPDGKTISKLDAGQPVLSRPLCPHPTYPRYNGSGDPTQASSFSCVPI